MSESCRPRCKRPAGNSLYWPAASKLINAMLVGAGPGVLVAGIAATFAPVMVVGQATP